MGGRPTGYRRPDADEPDDRYRFFEIVAASHVPTRGYESAAEIFPLLADADPASGPAQPVPGRHALHGRDAQPHRVGLRGTAPPRRTASRPTPTARSSATSTATHAAGCV